MNDNDIQQAALDAVPIVIEVGADIHVAVDMACGALARHPNVYQREGRLIQPIKVAGRVQWAREGEAGVPSLRDIPIATLGCELSRVAAFMKFDGRAKKMMPCAPPERVVEAVSQAAHWPGVRTLHGIVETPILRPDGTILQDRGYDAGTGVIFEPGGMTFPSIPETPTIDDARGALAALREPFEEFPFASDADRDVPTAIILTALAMGALDGANYPCFLLDANVQGTGKTLCADAVSWVLTGREVPKQTFPANDKNELEKILGGAAKAGASILCLDNVNGILGGDALEQRMTCRGTSQFRILGKTRIETLPWRTIVLASGNNVRTTVDMRRRIVRCRLLAKEEKPEERPIKRTDLRGWILANRSRLVVAGLTLLRAFVVAGRPKHDLGAMGNFEEWTALVAGAITWAGGANVLGARLRDAAAFDPTTEAYAAFLAEFAKEDPTLPGPWLLGKDYPAKEIAGMSCWDDLIPREDKSRALRVSGVLRQMDQRPIDGRQVMPCGADSKSKVRKYRVIEI